MNKKETIDFLLEETLIGHYDPRFPQHLSDVLMRLPEEAFDFLFCDLRIVQQVANSSWSSDLTEGTEKIIFILFVSDLCDCAKEEITYEIVHELAHLFLSKKKTPLDHLSSVLSGDVEIAADKQVTEWGFERELKASSGNCIYGKQKRLRESRSKEKGGETVKRVTGEAGTPA